MPTAARSRAEMPAAARASWAERRVVSQMSSASWLTQPSWGKIWRVGCWPRPRIWPCRSNTIARLDVVPWSMARTNRSMPPPARETRYSLAPESALRCGHYLRHPMEDVTRIVLIGFSGTGKTTVARLLADRLGWERYDSDEEIEREFGMTIPDVFAERGEAVFRAAER